MTPDHRRVVVVTGAASPLGAVLARGLASRGATVAIVGDGRAAESARGEIEGEGGSAVAVATDYADRRAIADVFGRVVDGLGPLDALVHAEIPPDALQPRPLVELHEKQWAEIWERGFLTTVRCCQVAHDHMRGRGGRIVLVTPTLALTGAARFAPYAALAEAQRALAKSAARQWGADGITVNCLAPGPGALLGDAMAFDETILAPPALPDASSEADLGPVLGFLAGGDSHALTGATLCVDGGVWMAP